MTMRPPHRPRCWPAFAALVVMVMGAVAVPTASSVAPGRMTSAGAEAASVDWFA